MTITAKQKKLVQLIVKDRITQADAYRQAYDTNASDNAIKVNACKELKKPVVKEYMQRLQAKTTAHVEKKLCISKEDNLNKVHLIVDKAINGGDLNAALKGLAESNKMQGYYAPEEVHNTHLVTSIIERNQSWGELKKGYDELDNKVNNYKED